MKQGGRIALIAPASGLPACEVESSAAFIEELGYEVSAFESCFSEYGYLSGGDELRAADVNKAFADTGIHGVLCLRGGYGCQRILDKLDFQLIRRNRKFFGGYSDITALHTAFNQMGVKTYHMPMAAKLAAEADGFTLEWAKAALEERRFHKFENPCGERLTTINGGIGRGALTGGNLCVLAASLGTPFEVDTKNKILFIEEVGEEPYKIDRAMNQLRLAGKLSAAAGIVFGAFTDCNPKDGAPSLTIPQIIEAHIPKNKPCVSGLACGHCLPTLSLPLGAAAELNAGEGELTAL